MTSMMDKLMQSVSYMEVRDCKFLQSRTADGYDIEEIENSFDCVVNIVHRVKASRKYLDFQQTIDITAWQISPNGGIVYPVRIRNAHDGSRIEIPVPIESMYAADLGESVREANRLRDSLKLTRINMAGDTL